MALFELIQFSRILTNPNALIRLINSNEMECNPLDIEYKT